MFKKENNEEPEAGLVALPRKLPGGEGAIPSARGDLTTKALEVSRAGKYILLLTGWFERVATQVLPGGAALAPGEHLRCSSFTCI